MTSERRTAVVVVLMLLGAGGVGVAAGALMGRSDRTAQSSAQDVLGGRAERVTRAGRGTDRRPAARYLVYALGPTAAGPGSTASSAPRPRPTRSRVRSPAWRSRRATRTTAPPGSACRRR